MPLSSQIVIGVVLSVVIGIGVEHPGPAQSWRVLPVS
jgi:hypothetical protein